MVWWPHCLPCMPCISHRQPAQSFIIIWMVQRGLLLQNYLSDTFICCLILSGFYYYFLNSLVEWKIMKLLRCYCLKLCTVISILNFNKVFWHQCFLQKCLTYLYIFRLKLPLCPIPSSCSVLFSHCHSFKVNA